MLVSNITGSHTPDILDCLSNLSSDEVFTPPQVVNAMLDLLPHEIWSNPDAKFLDPSCKSGVFLREIAKRLLVTLTDIFPDETQRKEHIYKNMLYGVAITELTSMMARRSLYYTKDATNPLYSVVKMEKSEGNILFSRTKHKYKDAKCIYCGAKKGVFDDEQLENHAYRFIHKEMKEEFEDMKFDVIIGNPPYQLSDGGHGASASPLYHIFVDKAKAMQPKYLCMIIPSRWFAGGKGLDEFRESMLQDKRIKELVDYPNASECFPGVEIKGGVCYFLWDKNYSGDCSVTTITNGEKLPTMQRALDENNVFVRFNEAISILNKVKSKSEVTLDTQVSSHKPFGLRGFFKDYKIKPFENSIKLYGNKFIGYITKNQLVTNLNWVKKYKVLTPRAGDGSGTYPIQVTGKPICVDTHSACTETYMVCGLYDDESNSINLQKYLKTKFVRFLISLKKPTQQMSKSVFSFVPKLDMTIEWSDKKLYERYELTKDEIAFIEKMIKEMA